VYWLPAQQNCPKKVNGLKQDVQCVRHDLQSRVPDDDCTGNDTLLVQIIFDVAGLTLSHFSF